MFKADQNRVSLKFHSLQASESDTEISVGNGHVDGQTKSDREDDHLDLWIDLCSEDELPESQECYLSVCRDVTLVKVIAVSINFKLTYQ